jgi:hypothetical protein
VNMEGRSPGTSLSLGADEARERRALQDDSRRLRPPVGDALEKDRQGEAGDGDAADAAVGDPFGSIPSICEWIGWCLCVSKWPAADGFGGLAEAQRRARRRGRMTGS